MRGSRHLGACGTWKHFGFILNALELGKPAIVLSWEVTRFARFLRGYPGCCVIASSGPHRAWSGRPSSQEAVAIIQARDDVGLGQGGGSQVMTHLDTESEFWHCFSQIVTLGKLFSVSELQFLLLRKSRMHMFLCNQSVNCKLVTLQLPFSFLHSGPPCPSREVLQQVFKPWVQKGGLFPPHQFGVHARSLCYLTYFIFLHSLLPFSPPFHLQPIIPNSSMCIFLQMAYCCPVNLHFKFI